MNINEQHPLSVAGVDASNGSKEAINLLLPNNLNDSPILESSAVLVQPEQVHDPILSEPPSDLPKTSNSALPENANTSIPELSAVLTLPEQVHDLTLSEPPSDLHKTSDAFCIPESSAVLGIPEQMTVIPPFFRHSTNCGPSPDVPIDPHAYNAGSYTLHDPNATFGQDSFQSMDPWKH